MRAFGGNFYVAILDTRRVWGEAFFFKHQLIKFRAHQQIHSWATPKLSEKTSQLMLNFECCATSVRAHHLTPRKD
jgi:hypothetical protein